MKSLQTSNYSNSNLNITFIPLSCLCVDDHKTSNYSYVRVAVIRTDVHPTGETWYTWHVCFPRQSTYATRTLRVGSPHTKQPFTQSSTVLDKATALKKKGSLPDPQYVSWPICRSIPSFSIIIAIKAVGVNPSIWRWICYIGLLNPYH
jgi:hypothetical protein